MAPRIRTRSTGLISVLALLLGLAATALPGAATAAGAGGDDMYRNPLAPRVPDAGPDGQATVDSCADPTVLRGQRPVDERFFYLYCTTDPLGDGDVDAGGNLRFHPVPTMRSRDLVHWTYVGDALPQPPSWASPGAGIWAPDVVHSRSTGLYYLTFVVTDTDDSLRGPDACASNGDSAVGVATSTSPTGPWTTSDQPVVGPRQDPGAACSFFWTFDPDVLGEDVGERSVLYYGSYYGGIAASHVRLTGSGMRAVGEPTQVAIGNRYEGAHVVRHDGAYYLFGSATNCCNGPLTSYGVFAGRSDSPLGPFHDRDGASLLAGRVGGTPVLLPNGNRWVGVGHNTTVRDDAGQWWTIYHAVDQDDPYFAPDPGFTKRPALLDRLTWRGGWPQVRAGRWASDTPQPAPVVGPGTGATSSPEPPAPQRAGRHLARFSDDFEGGLDPAWRWVRRPDAATYGVEDGALRWDTQPGDLARETNTASVLVRPAPRGDSVLQTTVSLDLPAEGCCQNYVQAGMVLYDSDDRYLKLAHVSIWETRQTEWAKEVPEGQPEYPRYGNGVVGPPGRTTTLRVVVERRPGPDRFTAWTKRPGDGWVRGGVWRHRLGPDMRLGLVSMGGEGYTARFRAVQAWRLAR